MTQNQKKTIISIIVFVFLYYASNFVFSYNERKIADSVIETLTAMPSATLYSTETPSPVFTITPFLLTVEPTNPPIRTDLIGSSFDYVIKEMGQAGFEFSIDDSETKDGRRSADGKYKYNWRATVHLYEEGHSLVYASYHYSYLGITESEEGLYSPGSEILIRIIVGDQIYTDVIEPWEAVRPLQDDSVLCFDGYVIGSNWIGLKQNYPNEKCY